MATRKRSRRSKRPKMRKVTLGRRLRKRTNKRRRQKGGVDIALNLKSFRNMTLPGSNGLGYLGTNGKFLDAPYQNTSRT